MIYIIYHIYMINHFAVISSLNQNVSVKMRDIIYCRDDVSPFCPVNNDEWLNFDRVFNDWIFAPNVLIYRI